MRILIGILYSIENEYAECVAAIKQQTHQDFEYFVIEGLPKREAHDALYGTFMSRAHEFDLFMKVDADMIIEDTRLFEKIIHKFNLCPGMHQLTIEVHDFFSDHLIDGMHTYRNNVRWPKRDNIVFTDTHPVADENKVYDSHELAPAAAHCKNPSPFQAFHYGLHRGVKARVYALERKMFPRRYMSDISSTWKHFSRTGDIRLGFALLGAELALRGDFGPEHIAYSNPDASMQFETLYAKWGSERIKKYTEFLRLRNRLAVPFLARHTVRSIINRLLAFSR